MNLTDVILRRKSVRKFQDKDVPNSVLNELIELARKGPSAGAIRGYEAIITRSLPFYNSPVQIVVCVEEACYEKRYGERGRNLYSIQDSAIFAAYMGLLLVDRGLCSVWIGAFREDKIRRAIKTELKPVAILCVGYGG
jgi:nitroreductase